MKLFNEEPDMSELIDRNQAYQEEAERLDRELDRSLIIIWVTVTAAIVVVCTGLLLMN